MAEADQGPDERQLHVAGTALAAFGLLVSTLRLFEQKGLLDQGEARLLVGSTLNTFQNSPIVTTPEVHVARQVLSSIAAQLGVPLTKPN